MSVRVGVLMASALEAWPGRGAEGGPRPCPGRGALVDPAPLAGALGEQGVGLLGRDLQLRLERALVVGPLALARRRVEDRAEAVLGGVLDLRPLRDGRVRASLLDSDVERLVIRGGLADLLLRREPGGEHPHEVRVLLLHGVAGQVLHERPCLVGVLRVLEHHEVRAADEREALARRAGRHRGDADVVARGRDPGVVVGALHRAEDPGAADPHGEAPALELVLDLRAVTLEHRLVVEPLLDEARHEVDALLGLRAVDRRLLASDDSSAPPASHTNGITWWTGSKPFSPGEPNGAIGSPPMLGTFCLTVSSVCSSESQS